MTAGSGALTVRDAMLRHPTVHPADLTLGQARAIFDTSPKTHLLLLVEDGVLLAALTRDDVPDLHDLHDLHDGATADRPAISVASLQGRTIGPDVPVGPLREAMAGTGLRRIAVVDDDMHLLGLLCLKKGLGGFCTDEGVEAMRAARSAAGQ